MLAVALAALGAVAPAASASQGSVPLEVAEFAAAPDGLVASLEDFFGPGANGKGIDFDDSTEIGPVSRVFTFSAAWLAGGTTKASVDLANRWTAPVSVGGSGVGVAIIWINPATVRPQLADFVPDPGFARALAELADDAWLIDDEARGAWFGLGPLTLTPLVTGTSGVTSDTRLTTYQAMLTMAGDPPVEDEQPPLGSVLSAGTIVAVALVVILALLVPVAWRRRRAAAAEPTAAAEPDEPEAEPDDPDEPEAEPDDE